MVAEKDKGISCNLQIHRVTKCLFSHWKPFISKKILYVVNLIAFTVFLGRNSCGIPSMCLQTISVAAHSNTCVIFNYDGTLSLEQLGFGCFFFFENGYSYSLTSALFPTERRQEVSAVAENVSSKSGSTSLNYSLLCQISRHPQLIMF